MIKLAKIIISIIFYFSLVSFVLCEAVAAADNRWLRYASCDDYIAYVDSLSVQCMENNIVNCWVKYVYSKEGVKNFLQFAKENNMKHAYNIKNGIYALVQQGLNCQNKTNAIYQSYLYSKAGTVIISDKDFNGNWDTIAPDSVAESLMYLLCPYCSDR